MTEEPDRELDFLIIFSMKGLMFNTIKDGGIQFNIGGNKAKRLTLRPVDPDGDKHGHDLGLECRLSGSYSVSQFDHEFVAAINERRFIPYAEMPFELPYFKRGEVKIGVDGFLRDGFYLPFESYPKSLRAICEQAREELIADAVRFLKLLVWRLDLDAPLEFADSVSLYWSIFGGRYRSVASKRQGFTVPILQGIRWEEYEAAEIEEMWPINISEPLAHELFRESRSIASVSPRSALLILATALEVGIKSHIARTAPETEWLIQNLPTPPIFRLFRDYLPIVHPQPFGEVNIWPLWKSTFSICQGLFENRNKLAHRGSMSIEKDALGLYFTTVSDLLRLLDALEGYDWAKSYISDALRQELGWPEPKQRRAKIIFHADY
jgi:hypothetical protein